MSEKQIAKMTQQISSANVKCQQPEDFPEGYRSKLQKRWDEREGKWPFSESINVIATGDGYEVTGKASAHHYAIATASGETMLLCNVADDAQQADG